MKKNLWLVIIIMFICKIGFSQGYQTSAGIRGAFASGITVKHFVDENAAVEGILSAGTWGGGITGLYELHAPAFEVERLYWYYGAGAHIAQWNDDFPGVSLNEGNHIVLGLDGILGLEYNIGEIPFTISADYKPSFNLTGFPGFWAYGAAISIRYTF